MTTYRIVLPTGPYRTGQAVAILAEGALLCALTGAILRIEPHELLVRVGGKPLAFQQHEPGVWSWCQPEQTSFEVGDDERQGRLV